MSARIIELPEHFAWRITHPRLAKEIAAAEKRLWKPKGIRWPVEATWLSDAKKIAIHVGPNSFNSFIFKQGESGKMPTTANDVERKR